MLAFPEHESIRAPVTALALLGRFLLAGEGPFLRCFDSRSSELLATVRVFQDQSIHGITTQDFHNEAASFVVWGGSSVRLGCISMKQRCQEQSELPQVEMDSSTIEAPDWILDLSVVSSSTNGGENLRAAAISAHNALFLLEGGFAPSLPASRSSSRRFRQLTAGSRCILYAAHVVWLNQDRLLAAAGTAFGEILVWSADLHSNGTAGTATLHKIFTGHEGSIFGVQISPDLRQIFPPYRRILASCSDDRSIRIWDVSEIESSEGLGDPSALVDALRDRETGFGSNKHAHDSLSSNSLTVAWGHQSRIWSIRYLDSGEPIEPKQNILRFISTGEDATSQLWHLSPSSTTLEGENSGVILTNKRIWNFHSGKNIWSIALACSKSDTTIYTGAADGAVTSHSTFHEDAARSGQGSIDEVWSVSDILEASSPDNDRASTPTTTTSDASTKKIASKNDLLRSYAFTGSNTFMIITNSGKLLAASLVSHARNPSPNKLSWRLEHEVADLKGYSVATSHISSDLMFFAGSSGKVYAYEEPSRVFRTVAEVGGKVAALFSTPIQKDDLELSEHIALFVTQMGSRPASLIILKRISADADFEVLKQLSLDFDPGFVATSFTYITADNGAAHIAVGSRKGAIFVYETRSHLGSAVEANTIDLAVPVLKLEGVHGEEAVTSLLWNAAAEGHRCSSIGHMFSAGRDGMCAVHQFDLVHRTSTIVHQCSLPFGPYIEGIYICPETSNLMVYGFRSKHFVLYDLTQEQELFAVDCGGAHRTWTFRPFSTDGNTKAAGRGGTFVWTKAAQLRVYSDYKTSHRIIQSGGHGREIKAAAACPVLTSHSSRGSPSRLIATGAEDTDIRIFSHDCQAKDQLVVAPRCIRTLRKHTTGVQEIVWLEDGQYLFSSGGCEEFYIWKVNTKVPYLGIGVVCEAVCSPESEDIDLRIMSFDVDKVKKTSSESPGKGDGLFHFLITVAFSDGTIRIYDYLPAAYRSVLSDKTSRNGPFSLLQTCTYSTRCLTQCVYLSSPHSFLTASTDGHIVLWSNQSSPAPSFAENTAPQLALFQNQWRRKVHQSSIKSLAHLKLNADTHLVLTGGDDSAIGITLICHAPYSSASTLLVSRAHGAAVTACALQLIPSPHERPSGASDVVSTVSSCSDHGRQEYRIRAITTSNDQRLKTWDVVVDLSLPGVEGVQVKRGIDIATAIADAASMAVFVPGQEVEDEKQGNAIGVIVCGVGMQSWRLETRK